MADFNPDEYLAETAGFDPDAYLSQGKEDSLLKKAGKAGLTGLDIVGSALRPLSDFPIALSHIPAGVVEYFRGKKSGPEIATESVGELGKSFLYGPTRAMKLALGRETSEDFKPRGFEKTLEQVGVPENFSVSKKQTVKYLPQGGVEIETSAEPQVENRKDIGKILDLSADLITGKIINKFASKQAPRMAEMAADMTPSMRAKLRPGTGQKLLDDGMVKFGDTAEDVLKRVNERKELAGKQIGSSLERLDELGAPKITKKELSEILSKKASALVKENADIDTSKGLTKIADDILTQSDIPEEMTLSYANKLAFQQGQKGKFNLMEYNPNAKAEARNAIRGAVEKRAASIADESKEAKDALFNLKEADKEFSFYKPVVTGIKKKLNTKTTPGGFYDTVSATTGAIAGSQQGDTRSERLRNALLGGIIAPVARRAIAPRAASSIAATLKGASKVPLLRMTTPTTRDLFDLYSTED